jgi:hypothetical protein
VKAGDGSTYGKFYPDAGLMVLSANALSSSLPGSGSTVAYQAAGGTAVNTIPQGFAQD